MEEEVLYMMDLLHQGYLDAMAMPIGRRKRFIEEHEHLEKARETMRERKSRGASKSGLGR